MFMKKSGLLAVMLLVSFGSQTLGYEEVRSNKKTKVSKKSSKKTKTKRQVTQTSAVKQADTKSFKQVVLDSEKPSVVLFYAEWCGHCKTFKPTFERMARNPQNKQYNFVKVDADKEASLGEKYNIESYPTMVLFKDGKEVARPSASEASINSSMQNL